MKGLLHPHINICHAFHNPESDISISSSQKLREKRMYLRAPAGVSRKNIDGGSGMSPASSPTYSTPSFSF